MARLPRLSVPGYAHHVIQRGNNRQRIFATTEDRLYLLNLLAEYATSCQVAVHAYVLMDNHLHLLLTPATGDGIPRLMQAVGRRYVRHFNDRQQRTGTLWEGRYRSTLIQTESYLLTCMVYMDLNPVRAGMVGEAREHPWSSHRHYIGQTSDRLITPHPLYWDLGNTPFAREAAYAEMVRAGITKGQEDALTQSTLRGWALGDAPFLAALTQQTDRRLTPGNAGRPKVVAIEPDKNTNQNDR